MKKAHSIHILSYFISHLTYKSKTSSLQMDDDTIIIIVLGTTVRDSRGVLVACTILPDLANEQDYS